MTGGAFRSDADVLFNSYKGLEGKIRLLWQVVLILQPHSGLAHIQASAQCLHVHTCVSARARVPLQVPVEGVC